VDDGGRFLQLDPAKQSVSFGVLAFVDATYAQLSLGYTMAFGGTTNIYGSAYGTTTVDATVPFDFDTTYLAFTALAKYPFKVGRTTLFPLVGVEYDLDLTYTNSSGSNLKSSLASPQDANQLWIRAGGGSISLSGDSISVQSCSSATRFRIKLSGTGFPRSWRGEPQAPPTSSRSRTASHGRHEVLTHAICGARWQCAVGSAAPYPFTAPAVSPAIIRF